jgi:hypothetical protein
MSAVHSSRIGPGAAKDFGAMLVEGIGGQGGLHVLDLFASGWHGSIHALS